MIHGTLYCVNKASTRGSFPRQWELLVLHSVWGVHNAYITCPPPLHTHLAGNRAGAVRGCTESCRGREETELLPAAETAGNSRAKMVRYQPYVISQLLVPHQESTGNVISYCIELHLVIGVLLSNKPRVFHKDMEQPARGVQGPALPEKHFG